MRYAISGCGRILVLIEHETVGASPMRVHVCIPFVSPVVAIDSYSKVAALRICRW